MVDYDVYNERRQQLIERVDVLELIGCLGLDVTALVDILDWDESHELAVFMGWIDDEESEV